MSRGFRLNLLSSVTRLLLSSNRREFVAINIGKDEVLYRVQMYKQMSGFINRVDKVIRPPKLIRMLTFRAVLYICILL